MVYSLLSIENTSEEVLKKGIEFVQNNKTKNGLWGYNKVWIEDADSSSFALLSLRNQTKKDEEINNWLNFQNNDGGFTTYNDLNALLSSLNSSNIKDIGGWIQSHFCVSAVAYLVLIELDLLHLSNYKKVKNYITKKLSSTDDDILSYWWTEDIYAVYYILLGATINNDKEIQALCGKKIDDILRRENSLNFFFKGLLLSSLCLNDNVFNNHKMVADRLFYQILNGQYNDGSWESSYSLKIPHPSVRNINTDSIVTRQDNKGTNIVVKDYKRLFTTISCLTAYGKKIL